MNQSFLFLKKNLSWLLLILLLLFVAVSYLRPRPMFNQSMPASSVARYDMYDMAESSTIMKSESGRTGVAAGVPASAPMPLIAQQRMVVRNTFLSLVVEDANQVVAAIEQKAVALGGYLVTSNLSTPEEGGTGSITVRVPADKRSEAMEAFKGLAVNVVSEQIDGQDITDAYQDIQEQLAILEQTKTKLESLLSTATRVQDILEVQRELTSIQQQIDSLKGQEEYLKQAADLTKITVYVSTDELALPYNPDESWRPKVVFKLAVRSLMFFLRGLASVAIWLVVFAPIWLTAIGLIYLLNKRFRR